MLDPDATPLGPFLGSRSEITRQQLRARRFRRLHRDVYALASQEPTSALACDAILLAVPDAVLSRATATALWRLPVEEDNRLHITRAPGSGVCRHDGVRTHRAALDEPDRDTCRGLAVTSLERTFVDLAAGSTLEQLVVVGDVVLRRSRREALERAVARSGRRKGVVLARAAVPLLDAKAASAGESRCRLLLHGAGYTSLQHAVPISDHLGHWVAEADLGDVEARVAIQYDGLAVHFGPDVQQRINDVARDELARAAGWEVVVLTARDLRHPHLALAKVAAAYQRAAERAAARSYAA